MPNRDPPESAIDVGSMTVEQKKKLAKALIEQWLADSGKESKEAEESESPSEGPLVHLSGAMHLIALQANNGSIAHSGNITAANSGRVLAVREGLVGEPYLGFSIADPKRWNKIAKNQSRHVQFPAKADATFPINALATAFPPHLGNHRQCRLVTRELKQLLGCTKDATVNLYIPEGVSDPMIVCSNGVAGAVSVMTRDDKVHINDEARLKNLLDKWIDLERRYRQ